MSELGDSGHVGLGCDLGNPGHSPQSNKIGTWTGEGGDQNYPTSLMYLQTPTWHGNKLLLCLHLLDSKLRLMLPETSGCCQKAKLSLSSSKTSSKTVRQRELGSKTASVMSQKQKTVAHLNLNRKNIFPFLLSVSWIRNKIVCIRQLGSHN